MTQRPGRKAERARHRHPHRRCRHHRSGTCATGARSRSPGLHRRATPAAEAHVAGPARAPAHRGGASSVPVAEALIPASARLNTDETRRNRARLEGSLSVGPAGWPTTPGTPSRGS